MAISTENPVYEEQPPRLPELRDYWLFFVLGTIPLAIIGYLVWRIKPEQWDELTSQPIDHRLLVLAHIQSSLSSLLELSRIALGHIE